ncbi:helix-turn-helix transcriptional regulator [Salininema proteolyticum]|uniref:AAA family ATPase n=1 Tax=Salininema proteolyticum TaxID=1607685 RepID=A0ABV8U2G8_9ACTN
MSDRGELAAAIVKGAANLETMYVSGPAGIGKTTLLGEVVDRLAGEFRLLQACPTRSERHLPGVVLIDLLTELRPLVDRLKPEHAESISQLLKGTAPPDRMPLFLATVELLSVASASRPLLIVLDDAQWTDESSAEVLSYVARRTDRFRGSLLIAERAGTESVVHPAGASHFELEPMRDEEIAAILSGQRANISAADRDHILATAGGNPLHAIECANFLSRHGRRPLPRHLDDLISARISPHSEDTKWALLVASLSTHPTLDMLQACDALPENCLEPAELSDTVTIDANGAIRFRHPLLPELVQSTATSSQKRRAHAALAGAVDDPVARARHAVLSAATADEETAAAAEGAAAQASSRGAPAEAAQLVELAACRTPSACERDRRRLRAAEYHLHSGNEERSHQLAAEVADGDFPDLRFQAGLLLYDLAGQNIGKARRHLQNAAPDAAGDPRRETELSLHLAELSYYDRDFAASVHHAKEALVRAEAQQDDYFVLRALTVSSAAADDADPEAQVADLERANAIASSLPLDPRTVEARQLWCTSNLFRGEGRTAREAIVALEEEVRRTNQLSLLRQILVSSATIYYRTGDCGRSLAAGRECAELTEGTDLACVGQSMAAQTEWAGGSFDSAIANAHMAIASCKDAGDQEWLDLSYAVLGLSHSAKGDHAEAVEAFTRAHHMEKLNRHTEPAVFPWHTDHIASLAATGRMSEATAQTRALERRIREHDRPFLRLPLARAKASCQAAAGELDSAHKGLSRALKEYTDAEPLEKARSHLALARIALRLRRRSAANASFHHAAERFAELRARPWVAVAKRHIEEGGAMETAPQMTATDRRIVELVAAGLTNADISANLFLSVKAIEGRLTKLYRKFNVNNRAELVARVRG